MHGYIFLRRRFGQQHFLDKPALLPLLAFFTLFIDQAFYSSVHLSYHLASHGHSEACSVYFSGSWVFLEMVWIGVRDKRLFYTYVVYIPFWNLCLSVFQILRIHFSSSVPRIHLVLFACLWFIICAGGIVFCKPRLLPPRVTSADFTLVRSSCFRHHLRDHVSPTGRQEQWLKLPRDSITCQRRASYHESHALSRNAVHVPAARLTDHARLR
jgi:hypothetical protein